MAFTLMELLVVLGIIGMLTALSLPFMKGINRSNTMGAAVRQMLDDLEFARNRAISGRTTVYVLFMPPVVQAEATIYDPLRASQPAQWTNMLTGQQTSYALYTRKGMGEQPGQENPRYLTKWYSLPQGIYIPDYKFIPGNDIGDIHPFPTSDKLPVPTINGVKGGTVPYIAFDYLGRLSEGASQRDEIIPLTQGSIFFARNSSGLLWEEADVQENPPGYSTNSYNRIRIDWLTGRAKVERREIQ